MAGICFLKISLIFFIIVQLQIAENDLFAVLQKGNLFKTHYFYSLLKLNGEKIEAEASDLTFKKPQRELVVLVHGFCRTHRDMKSLKKNLESYGYHVVSPDFPTFTGTLEALFGKAGF